MSTQMVPYEMNASEFESSNDSIPLAPWDSANNSGNENTNYRNNLGTKLTDRLINLYPSIRDDLFKYPWAYTGDLKVFMIFNSKLMIYSQEDVHGKDIWYEEVEYIKRKVQNKTIVIKLKNKEKLRFSLDYKQYHILMYNLSRRVALNVRPRLFHLNRIYNVDKVKKHTKPVPAFFEFLL
ncbi:hypothetical protein RDWZM_006379 [Blomia tropicalis]|uniref:Uncharacterized protein n=1 Tax=Blomia tropicalis TaxID=40697 RepID=A0A9Q0M7T4_BLOTA|nr:hypothetical protein RDWZM_006379 [Blomia tropicalis]